MSEKTWQGDQGVMTAALHYSRLGFTVSKPVTEHTKYDLIVDIHGVLSRVQVKTTTYTPNGPFVVQLRTNGANYTTKTKVTKISADQVDLVFVLTATGECYEFPVNVVQDRATVTLGPKCDQYKLGTRYPAISRH